jgi:hypothetical protein
VSVSLVVVAVILGSAGGCVSSVLLDAAVVATSLPPGFRPLSVCGVEAVCSGRPETPAVLVSSCAIDSLGIVFSSVVV